MKNFYIFRHGETDMNKQGFVQGQGHNPPLNQTGIEQAKNLIPILKDKDIEVIFSSPLTRAKETALILAKALKLEIILSKSFVECCYGDIEGLEKEKAKQMFVNVYTDWEKNHAGFPNGETKSEIEGRISRKMNEIASLSPYENIAVATHGGIIRAMGIYYGSPIGVVSNGAILHIQYDGKFHIKNLL